MEVAALRTRVVFQKRRTVADAEGNHGNEWDDYYACFATIGGEGPGRSGELSAAGQTVENDALTVTVRSCQRARAITSSEYRVRLGERLYDITAVDHAGFRNRSMKFYCRRERR